MASGRGIPVIAAVGAALLSAAGAWAGLALAPGGTPAAGAHELTSFDDCDGLQRHFRDLALPEVTAWGLGGYWYAATAMGAPEDAAGSAAARDAVGPGATGTNLQEQGVDEPDLVKSRDGLLVTVSGGELHAVDVTGTNPRSLGTLDLPEQPASELLLFGDQALVVGTRWSGVLPGAEPRQQSSGGPDGMRGEQTVLTTVDLSDPTRPRVTSSLGVEGRYVSARLHDGVVRVVVESRPYLPFEGLSGPEPEDEARVVERNRDVVRHATAADWLPRRVLRGPDGSVLDDGPLLACDAVRYPRRPSGVGTISVLTIDTAAEASLADARATGVVGTGDLVYASSDRLYVATTEGGWMRGPASAEPASGPATTVHAFDAGHDETPYLASGTVDGYLLSRWAMSEHEGRLRVATTSVPPWSASGEPGVRSEAPATESSVVVLEERADRLVPVGQVGGLGKGERIRAVRWFGDLGAVVTFRQTDPLYLIDVSRPTRPRVVGELEVPGYSAYLHPVGDGLLLGVGQDADNQGRTRGVQVSTFDISDPRRPQRVDTLRLDADMSEVEHDARAFTYLPDQRLAIFPVQSYDWSSSSAVAVTVGSDGMLAITATYESRQPVRRTLPAGDRLAVVTDSDVTLVDRGRLEPSGTVRTGSVSWGVPAPGG